MENKTTYQKTTDLFTFKNLVSHYNTNGVIINKFKGYILNKKIKEFEEKGYIVNHYNHYMDVIHKSSKKEGYQCTTIGKSKNEPMFHKYNDSLEELIKEVLNIY